MKSMLTLGKVSNFHKLFLVEGRGELVLSISHWYLAVMAFAYLHFKGSN